MPKTTCHDLVFRVSAETELTFSIKWVICEKVMHKFMHVGRNIFEMYIAHFMYLVIFMTKVLT